MSNIIKGAKVISRITSKEQIDEFIRTPSWSIREFDTKEQSQATFDIVKLNKLSGLSFKYDEIEPILSKQIQFSHLLLQIEIDPAIIRKAKGRSSGKLKYNELIDQINNLKQDTTKGEKGDWGAMELPKIKSSNYYILRESLYK